MAFLGVAFLSADGNFQISAADTAVFISAVLFAVQIILLGYFIQYSNPLLLVAAEMFTGFAISLLFSALFETGNSFSGAMAGIGPILFTGLGSLGIANIIQSYAQKKASPSVAAIILSFESVFGAIFGIILLNERLNAFQSIGCILIFLALLVSQYEKQSKEKQV